MSTRRCTSNLPSTMISLSRVRMKTSTFFRMHWRCTSSSYLTGSSVSQPGARIRSDVHAVTTAQTVCVNMCTQHVRHLTRLCKCPPTGLQRLRNSVRRPIACWALPAPGEQPLLLPPWPRTRTSQSQNCLTWTCPSPPSRPSSPDPLNSSYLHLSRCHLRPRKSWR
jgi:hypothetical protein